VDWIVKRLLVNEDLIRRMGVEELEVRLRLGNSVAKAKTCSCRVFRPAKMKFSKLACERCSAISEI
jgi:hypothetical protein